MVIKYIIMYNLHIYLHILFKIIIYLFLNLCLFVFTLIKLWQSLKVCGFENKIKFVFEFEFVKIKVWPIPNSYVGIYLNGFYFRRTWCVTCVGFTRFIFGELTKIKNKPIERALVMNESLVRKGLGVGLF